MFITLLNVPVSFPEKIELEYPMLNILKIYSSIPGNPFPKEYIWKVFSYPVFNLILTNSESDRPCFNRHLNLIIELPFSNKIFELASTVSTQKGIPSTAFHIIKLVDFSS